MSKTEITQICVISGRARQAIIGTLAVLAMSNTIGAVSAALLPFAAGNLLYIAGSDLIPELHKERGLRVGILQLLAMILGMASMYAILLTE